MTNATNTATVESLTAEVRVLMVGNRQITLSIAKQLDYVPLHDLKVFGRVKLGTTQPNDLVIGSDPSGNLALACYGEYRKPDNWSAVLEIPADWPDGDRPQIGWAIGMEYSRYHLILAGIRVEIAAKSCRVRPGRDTYYAAIDEWCKSRYSADALPEPNQWDFDGAGNWDPGPHEAKLKSNALKQLADADRRHELYESAKTSPLIVLAGLK